MTFLRSLLFLVVFLGATIALAQDTPADNMDILEDKVRADKKLVVATNMGLSESEAKAFWPIYEDHQVKLSMLNERVAALIDSYAGDYIEGTLTDEKAVKLIDEMIAIEEAQVDAQKAVAQKLKSALPVVKAARYLQIENKIRAVIAYEVAANVPLAE